MKKFVSIFILLIGFLGLFTLITMRVGLLTTLYALGLTIIISGIFFLVYWAIWQIFGYKE